MKEVIILQHVPNENAGTILNYLNRVKIPFRQVNLFEPEYAFPEIKNVRSLVVMGGPMNVYEEEKYPFLREENRFIRDSILKGVPYLGICLGSQLLAKAMDAKVYKAPQEEIGWDDVRFSPGITRDPLFGPLGLDRLRVLQWHGDTFDLPKGAQHLASSKAVPNQAFCVDRRFYGLQFHVEVSRPMVEDWFKSRADLSGILSEFDAYRDSLAARTNIIYDSFFKLS